MTRLLRLDGPRTRARLESRSPGESIAIGKRLGELIPAGAVLSLEGGLGAGKTLFAKGVCAGLGIEGEELSPSFILVEEYRGDLPVLHFDLYRLDEVGEVERIGLYDAVDGRNVVIVEWGDRLPEGVLSFDVRIRITITGERERAIEIEGAGDLIEELTD